MRTALAIVALSLLVVAAPAQVRKKKLLPGQKIIRAGRVHVQNGSGMHKKH